MLGISLKYTYNVICHVRVHICTHMNIYIGVDGMRMQSSLYADAFPLAHPFLLGRLLFAAANTWRDEKSLEPEAKSWPPHGPKQINKHTCFWQLTSLSGPDRHRAMPANGSEATFGRRENYTKISFVKQSRGDMVTRTEPHMHLAMQVSYLASS